MLLRKEAGVKAALQKISSNSLRPGARPMEKTPAVVLVGRYATSTPCRAAAVATLQEYQTELSAKSCPPLVATKKHLPLDGDTDRFQMDKVEALQGCTQRTSRPCTHHESRFAIFQQPWPAMLGSACVLAAGTAKDESTRALQTLVELASGPILHCLVFGAVIATLNDGLKHLRG